MTPGCLVSLVDDDLSVRESLPVLLRELGFRAEAFASAEDFLAYGMHEPTRCLLLDITMPGMSGPALQQELAHRQLAIPIVFITAAANDSLRAELLQAGAVDCLYKPFTDAALLAALKTATGMN